MNYDSPPPLDDMASDEEPSGNEPPASESQVKTAVDEPAEETTSEKVDE